MTAPWETFFREKVIHILESSSQVLDIGGGLRVDESKNNRVDKGRAFLRPYLAKVKYTVMDPVPDYNPDVVGDIHNMPFKDSALEAIFCIAVLEHVQDPLKAVAEMHRTLKPGGKVFVYMPFLYGYHAQPGYYGDYWRITEDGVRYAFKDFSKLELMNVRGSFETLLYMTPLNKFKLFGSLGRVLDYVTGRIYTKQTSGYHIYAEK